MYAVYRAASYPGLSVWHACLETVGKGRAGISVTRSDKAFSAGAETWRIQALYDLVRLEKSAGEPTVRRVAERR